MRATGLPYYLLGRVPCRSVSLIAIVVGAVAYERRVVYTREPYYLPLLLHPMLSLQWTMGPPSLSAHFAPTRINQRANRVRSRASALYIKIGPQSHNRPFPHSSHSVPWSKFRAKFARSTMREKYTAKPSVCTMVPPEENLLTRVGCRTVQGPGRGARTLAASYIFAQELLLPSREIRHSFFVWHCC